MPDKITLQTIAGAFNLDQLNQNFTLIETFVNDEALSRANATASANQMESDLDMNGYDLQNVGSVALASLSIGGVDVTPSSVTPVAGTYMTTGSAASPGFYVYGDTNTGLYAPGADQLGISVGGSAVAVFSSSGLNLQGLDLTVDDITADDITADVIQTATMTITTGGLVISAGGLNVTGTVTLPAHVLADGTTATTKAAGTNSTAVATCEFVQTAATNVPKVIVQVGIQNISSSSETQIGLTSIRITIGTHSFQANDKVYVDWSGSDAPADGECVINAVGATTIDVTVPSDTYNTITAATIRSYACLSNDTGVTSCTLTSSSVQIGFAAFTDATYTVLGVRPSDITAKSTSSLTVTSASAGIQLYGTLA